MVFVSSKKIDIVLTKKFEYEGVLEFYMWPDTNKAVPSLLINGYIPSLHGSFEKFYRNIITLSHGDRLKVFDKDGYVLFDEKICRNFCFSGYLKFDLSFVPFFFDERELNNWISFFDRKLNAIITKYYI